MLKVSVPKINSSELKYTVDVLLDSFLGLDYTLLIEERLDVRIVCDEMDVIFESSFFKNDIEFNFDKLNVKRINASSNHESKDILSLFEGRVYRNGSIIYPLDLLASTFFMLTRWEEHVNPVRDQHGRFPANESIAFKEGFLDRPIVNEYVEILWALLVEIGCKQKRKKRNYTLIPTHDVDKPYLFDGLLRSGRYVAGSLKRGRFSELARYTKHLITGSDPFDTYDKMMDLSEREGTRSNFFFLQKGKSKHDESHDIKSRKVQKLIQHIRDREHNIGFHPSYEAHDNSDLFAQEKEILEKVVGAEVNTGRHHFLRWNIIKTPQIWEQNNMIWDSTLGYADHAGFRCGVCYPFPLYDLEKRKQLKVQERPLIAMEWSLIHYEGLSLEGSISKIEYLKNQVKKYNGEFVFLYHNSAFFVDEYYKFSDSLLNAFYEN